MCSSLIQGAIRDIWIENNKKWRQVLNQYLVDEDTMQSINGGRYSCSDWCLDEESYIKARSTSSKTLLVSLSTTVNTLLTISSAFSHAL